MSDSLKLNETLVHTSEVVTKGVIGVSLVFSEINSIVGAVIILVLLDFITGLWASIKSKGRSSFTSQRMSNTVSKIFLYIITLIAAMFCEQYLTPEVPMIKITSYFVGMTEIKSIYENVGTILNMDLYRAIRQFLERKKDGNS